MQYGAHDPAGGGQAFLDHRFVEIEHVRAVIAEQAGLASDRALLLYLVEQAEPPIGAKRGAGYRDARAINAPVRVEIDQVDLHPSFGKADRARHSADTPAHDKRRCDAADAFPSHA